MSKIFDNIESNFDSGLHDILTNVGVERADFCVGYFNLRGWRLVTDDVKALPGGTVVETIREKGRPDREMPVRRHCRLLVGMHQPPQDLLRALYSGEDENATPDSEQLQRWKRSVLRDFRKQLTLGVPSLADETALRSLRNQLHDGHVAVRLHLRFPLHAKLYLAHRPGDTSNPIMSIMGSSNLTYNGLVRNGELDAEFGDPDDNRKFADWFDKRWNDRYSLDITEDLVALIDESWASESGPTPYEIYLKVAYHLSREARSGVSEYHLPRDFERDLFDFQKTAVQLVVRHLEKRNGAMIGDVVGLGKTITACAVAKFYEERFGTSTLVVCPPNLVEMWERYARDYDIKMEVRSVAARLDPARERYYKLVVIDESHNLRNGGGQRYAGIKDFLASQPSKVLLLTATPYNKDFSDLASQLKLFVDPDADLGIRPEAAIREAGGERAFATAHPDVALGSVRAFENSFSSDDWRDLMKLYLVRRTRTFIKKNYAKTDAHSARKYLEMRDGTRNYFPDRVPRTITFRTRPGDMFERLYDPIVADLMDELRLPRYGLQKYVDPAAAATAVDFEKQILDNLSRAGKRLMGFCRSGFFKRMDSSGAVFLMSLYHHAVRNAMIRYAVRNGLDIPLRADVELSEFWEDDDVPEGELRYAFPTDPATYEKEGEDAYNRLVAGAPASVRWISSRFFKKSLAVDLKKDVDAILRMLRHCGEWNPAEDEKLGELVALVAERHPKDKILVFTQYTDTARYVRRQLEARGIAAVDEVDGDTENVGEKVARFSPASNKRRPSPDDTRILVATDVLSEGQNLQDAHVVVNYDLPWAIIRLIQRAGRVDRIGQKASQVLCYSFFPQEGVDRIIRLRERLNDRINRNAETVGSDEVFFEGNKQNLEDIFNEKAGILDEEDGGDVDFASEAYQVWEEATRDDPALAARIQDMADVVYSTKAAGARPRGAIVYARTRSDYDALVWMNADGSVASQSPKTVFDALACAPDTPALPPLPDHHRLVAAALENVRTYAASTATAGVLGSKSSTKYRLFNCLNERLKEGAPSLFETNLKETADEVYSYPLKESAKNAIGKMFHRRDPVGDIVQAALELQRNGDLCVVPDSEEAVSARHEARIVCSMGLA